MNRRRLQVKEDTIAAIATPRGKGARGIVRLSGPDALPVAESCLDRALPKAAYRLHNAAFRLPRTAPFPVSVYIMTAPRSYTREDVVEIHAPGAPPLLAAILDELRHSGARLAAPGEFTRRAFLNGRIDLAQAEAVLAVIRSASDAEEKLALSALRGDMRDHLRPVRRQLMELAVDIEAGLDFVEDDISFAPESRRQAGLRSAAAAIREILEHSYARTVFHEEVVAVLYGATNAGKSSIFNMLAGSPQAIVEPTPGTTRDFLEAAVEIEGAHFLLVDTAGVRTPAEVVEQIAVETSRRIAREAQIVLFVVDASLRPSPEVDALYRDVRRLPHLVLLNKSDKPSALSHDQWRRRFPDAAALEISAETGTGRDELELAMARQVHLGGVNLSGSRFLLVERQKACLGDAADALKRARDAVDREAGDEILSLEIRQACEALGNVTGESYLDDLLDEVFSRFCLGK